MMPAAEILNHGGLTVLQQNRVLKFYLVLDELQSADSSTVVGTAVRRSTALKTISSLSASTITDLSTNFVWHFVERTFGECRERECDPDLWSYLAIHLFD